MFFKKHILNVYFVNFIVYAALFAISIIFFILSSFFPSYANIFNSIASGLIVASITGYIFDCTTNIRLMNEKVFYYNYDIKTLVDAFNEIRGWYSINSNNEYYTYIFNVYCRDHKMNQQQTVNDPIKYNEILNEVKTKFPSVDSLPGMKYSIQSRQFAFQHSLNTIQRSMLNFKSKYALYLNGETSACLSKMALLCKTELRFLNNACSTNAIMTCGSINNILFKIKKYDLKQFIICSYIIE